MNNHFMSALMESNKSEQFLPTEILSRDFAEELLTMDHNQYSSITMISLRGPVENSHSPNWPQRIIYNDNSSVRMIIVDSMTETPNKPETTEIVSH